MAVLTQEGNTKEENSRLYSYLLTYDLYETFLGPKWHSPNGSMPLHRAQKSIDCQDPAPPPLALVMDLPISKPLRTGPFKS